MLACNWVDLIRVGQQTGSFTDRQPQTVPHDPTNLGVEVRVRGGVAQRLVDRADRGKATLVEEGDDVEQDLRRTGGGKVDTVCFILRRIKKKKQTNKKKKKKKQG